MQLSTASLKRILASLVVVALVTGTGAAWFAKRANAQEKTTGYWAFGTGGIGAGQVLRLNAVTVGVGHNVPMELMFLDREGNVLSRVVDVVSPGKTISLDLPFAPGVHGKHLPARPLVRWATQLGSGYVIPSLEVIDEDSGRVIAMAVNPEG